MTAALDQTLALLASLQRERGFALRAGPLSPLETLAAFEMQSTLTSLSLETVEKAMPSFASLMPRRFFDALALRNNETFRGSQPLESLAEWYVFNLEEPVSHLALSQITQSAPLSPAQMSATGHFLASIASLAHLRDIGLSIYAKAEISQADMNRMRAAAAACLARARLFFGLADEITRRIAEETRAPETGNDMDETLAKIRDGQAKAFLAETSAPVWFELFDNELAAKQELLRRTIAQLESDGAELALLNAPGQSLDGDIEHSLDFIRGLPLFRGLSEGTLRGALKGSRFVSLEKNAAFLTQGEPTSRLFIVLDGWVKVFKTTAEGEEAILHIAGKKECLLDNASLSAGLSSISGKAVTKTRLLALSLSVLRDNVSRNKELEQNLLSATTARLAKLVAQFEQITLRTAEERVGWFFANLHLETGLEGAPLELPYDKALIASYLNIKPETFSRTLGAFKKRGFKIDKHRVVLPHPQALCAYCDPDMALRCCRAEAVNCAPIRAAKRAEGR